MKFTFISLYWQKLKNCIFNSSLGIPHKKLSNNSIQDNEVYHHIIAGMEHIREGGFDGRLKVIGPGGFAGLRHRRREVTCWQSWRDCDVRGPNNKPITC